jgi:hypothetical protein
MIMTGLPATTGTAFDARSGAGHTPGRSAPAPVPTTPLGRLTRVHRLARGRRGAKSVARQWIEMLAFLVLCGNGPRYYQMAALWRHECSWRQITGHWSQRRYEAELDRLCPPAYRKISQHKLVEKSLLTTMGVPTPRLLGCLDAASGRQAGGEPLRSAEDLERLFRRETVTRACFKDMEGWSGSGFVAADIVRDDGDVRFRPLLQKRTLTAAAFLDYLAFSAARPRVVEAFMEQHPAYAMFNPTSVNTLRLWVVRRGDRAETRLGFLRIGRAGSLVDNHGAGGIIAPVGLATGELYDCHDGKDTRTTFPFHPDHGAPIIGQRLPRFDQAKALAEQTLLISPGLTFAGMDVAMAVDGPRIIELNPTPDRTAPGMGWNTTTRDAFL